MVALPNKESFTGSNVSQGSFKDALDDLRDYLAGLLGADGAIATARQQLNVDPAGTAESAVTALGLPEPVANTFLRRNAGNTGYSTIGLSALADLLAPLVDPVPIGGYQFVQINMPGASEPDRNRYIRLHSQDVVYNGNRLTNLDVSGAVPYTYATATINVPSSPMHGQTVRLLEQERRFLRAGYPGTLQDDELKEHAHQFVGIAQAGSGTASRINAGTVDGDIASTRSTGGEETRPRNIGVAVYMRVL